MRQDASRFVYPVAILALFAMGLVHATGLAQDTEQNRSFQNDRASVASTDNRQAQYRETIAGCRQAKNGFSWKYGYDLALTQGLLIATVRINLIPSQGITRWDLNRMKPIWKKGIEEIWSHRFSLECPDGKRYPILVEAIFQGPRFHHHVIVRPGAGRTDELNWNIQDSPELAAHEFGHMIGLYDEYENGAVAPIHAVVDPTSSMTSNPGKGVEAHARHYESFRRWFVSKTLMSNVRILHEKGNHE